MSADADVACRQGSWFRVWRVIETFEVLSTSAGAGKHERVGFKSRRCSASSRLFACGHVERELALLTKVDFHKKNNVMFLANKKARGNNLNKRQTDRNGDNGDKHQHQSNPIKWKPSSNNPYQRPVRSWTTLHGLWQRHLIQPLWPLTLWRARVTLIQSKWFTEAQ